MFALPALSIADLQARTDRVEWFESVAVVAEIASAAAALGETRLPELAAFGLTAGAEAAIAPRVPPMDTAVRQLGRALEALIAESGAPDPLRQLASFAMNAPDNERLEQFAAALHYYERPNRSQVLRDVVARFVTPDEGIDVEAELARLRQRASERAREEAAHRPKREHHLPSFLKSRWFLWPAALVCAVVLAGVVSWKVPRVRSVFADALVWARSIARLGPAEAPVAVAADAPADNPGKTAAKPAKSTAAADAPPTPADPASGEAPGVSSQPPPAAPAEGLPNEALPPSTVVTLVPEKAVESAAAPPPPADGLYSASTPGVTPPVPLRPNVATDADPVAASEAGILELVIDEAGAVERVRLVSSSGRFQDRMLLSAAKAWRFKPATLDGRPVRFRAQVRLTW